VIRELRNITLKDSVNPEMLYWNPHFDVIAAILPGYYAVSSGKMATDVFNDRNAYIFRLLEISGLLTERYSPNRRENSSLNLSGCIGYVCVYIFLQQHPADLQKM
jgi:hypothetical protein